jgi:Ion transport protein
MMKNPDWGITNFDTFGWSFLIVYQICTLEGWSDIMRAIMRTFQSIMAIYFIVIVLIGAFFLLNLLIAIIKVKFTEQQNNKDLPINNDEDREEAGVYRLDELRMIGVYKKRDWSDRLDT